MRFTHWIAAAALASATMAWADRPYTSHDRDDTVSVYDDVQLPERHEMKNVRSMAERLDNLMDDLGEQAHKRAKHGNLARRESDALRSLDLLAEHAATFRRTTEKAQDRPRWTADDFDRLLGAYLLVDEDLDTLDRAEMLDKDYRKVQELMNNLVTYYGGYPRYGSRAYDRLTTRAQMDLSDDTSERRIDNDENDLRMDLDNDDVLPTLGQNREEPRPDMHVHLSGARRMEVPDVRPPSWDPDL